MKTELAAHVLNHLENDLSRSLIELRRLVYELRPPIPYQLGLIGVLCVFISR